MNARLIKETRALLPIFACMLPLIVVPQLVWPMAGFGFFAFAVACVLMAGSSFGTEFQHRTISLLLSQPIPRSVIWRDKMLVLGAGMVTSLVALAGLPGGFCFGERPCRVAGAGSCPAVRLLRYAVLDAGAATGHRWDGGRGRCSVRDAGDICHHDRAFGRRKAGRSRCCHRGSPPDLLRSGLLVGICQVQTTGGRGHPYDGNYACRLVWRPFS
jgi:hypothetical protein